MANITQNDVDLVANSLFAKARFAHNDRFISKTTGATVDIGSYLEIMLIETQDLSGESMMRKQSMVFASTKALDFIQEGEREHIESLVPEWEFFAEYFAGKYGNKVDMSPLFKAYIDKFRNTSKRKFSNDLARWCVEMNLPRTVKNYGAVKKIIVIRS